MPDAVTSVTTEWPASLAAIGTPRPGQLAVAEALLAGRRVVLRAPAGSGKTMAAWLPWLASRLSQHDFPATMLHVLPGGTFYGDLQARLADLAGVARIAVQTESDACDPFLLADATLTSVEQLLSVAIHRPLGLHPSLANINAGVLLGAYLVFDEFPVLRKREALRLWAGMLREYCPDAAVLFAGATMPRPIMEWLSEMCGADMMEITVDNGGTRTWQRKDALTAEGILRRHAGRTIVVCNTVRGAQTLYRALHRALAGSTQGPELLLLHQYQLPHDRAPIETLVRERFTQHGPDALLVTTTGIEVGASISAELVITEPAAPDALVRRAGRCARHVGEIGRVVVAPIMLPASTVYAASVSETMLQSLCDDAPRSFVDEQAAYDDAWEHLPRADRMALLGDWPNAKTLADETRALMKNYTALPCRDATRVGVCLHCVPETVADPFELERFSIPISTLERGYRQWQATGSPGEWFALIPRWTVDGQRRPSWSPLQQGDEFRADARLVVLNGEAVSYDPIIGLELLPGDATYQSARIPTQHTSWHPFDQHAQLFEEHAARALAAYEQAEPRYRHMLRRLGARWHIPLVDLERWMRLAILWHDAGKLTADWQRAAFRWQAENRRRPAEGVLGRIDYQAARDGVFPCPAHAAAGAQALVRALAFVLGRHVHLHQGTLAALCHHHGLVATDAEDLTPHPEAWAILLELAEPVLDTWQLRKLDRAGWTLLQRGAPDIPAVPPVEPNAWQAYSILVRAIRLADREIALKDIMR